jgi:hypothetical protein
MQCGGRQRTENRTSNLSLTTISHFDKITISFIRCHAIAITERAGFEFTTWK